MKQNSTYDGVEECLIKKKKKKKTTVDEYEKYFQTSKLIPIQVIIIFKSEFWEQNQIRIRQYKSQN